ncbi:hypothetical protein VCR1J2_400094 [Vibrio coralliirubri]|nr:hypothetical protein VCR1J2_400094 [Vibrio coralliirubri]
MSGIGNVEWCNVLHFLLIVLTKAQWGKNELEVLVTTRQNQTNSSHRITFEFCPETSQHNARQQHH